MLTAFIVFMATRLHFPFMRWWWWPRPSDRFSSISKHPQTSVRWRHSIRGCLRFSISPAVKLQGGRGTVDGRAALEPQSSATVSFPFSDMCWKQQPCIFYNPIRILSAGSTPGPREQRHLWRQNVTFLVFSPQFWKLKIKLLWQNSSLWKTLNLVKVQGWTFTKFRVKHHLKYHRACVLSSGHKDPTLLFSCHGY